MSITVRTSFVQADLLVIGSRPSLFFASVNCFNLGDTVSIGFFKPPFCASSFRSSLYSDATESADTYNAKANQFEGGPGPLESIREVTVYVCCFKYSCV